MSNVVNFQTCNLFLSWDANIVSSSFLHATVEIFELSVVLGSEALYIFAMGLMGDSLYRIYKKLGWLIFYISWLVTVSEYSFSEVREYITGNGR